MSLRGMQSMAAKRYSRGVTLIELLVSLVIGLLLVAGAASVYLQSRDTYRTTETAARLQEVARYALDTIEPDIRLAGYWGLTNRADFIENRGAATDTAQTVAGNITDNCGTNWIVDVAQFVDARDQTLTGGSYNLACAATVPTGVTGPTGAAMWSDVLIIRRATSDTRAPTNGRVQIQTNRVRGVIFKDGAIPAGFAASPASETRDMVVNAYYISQRGNGANGLPRFELRRQTLNGTSISDIDVVSGVEDLQVELGIDNNGDGNADRYVNPGSVPAGARIASARIWLRIVADDREAGFTDDTNYAYANTTPGTATDGRRRVLISKTIQIRNSRA